MTEPIDDFDGLYRWLSNFWPDGPGSNEHYYQAAKTDDPVWAARILAARLPNDAKKLGRKCPARSTWDDEKLDIMRALLWVKFTPGSEMAGKLLATGDAELIEGNWWHDTHWGVCTGKRCKSAPHEPHGDNHLGKLLMEIRVGLDYLSVTAMGGDAST